MSTLVLRDVSTLVLRDDTCLLHDPGPQHPERAERLAAIFRDLEERPIEGTVAQSPRRATRKELLAVHSDDHVSRMEATRGRLHVQLDADTATSPRSHDAALVSAGAALVAAESVVSGAAQGAFAIVRPPGHHALRDAAMGFCLYNNVAIAAEHAVRELGCRRVLVLDPDVHHGNGTQAAFWSRSDVMYVSSHRFPFYPGTGAVEETGAGRGEGFTINLPLPGGSGDADLLHVHEDVVTPVVDQWQPDLILVSAGFDTWMWDPLGGMLVTEDGYRALFATFARWSRDHCPGRLAFVLEGGYNLTGVATGVRAAIETMTGASPEVTLRDAPSRPARETAARARRLLRDRWSSLR